jgi:hypothetical protein
MRKLFQHLQYAYPDENKERLKSFGNDGDSELSPHYRNGIPFDILSLSEPDLACPLPDRKVGGLGCYLIRKMADGVQYRRQGDANILNLLVRKAVFSGNAFGILTSRTAII